MFACRFYRLSLIPQVVGQRGTDKYAVTYLQYLATVRVFLRFAEYVRTGVGTVAVINGDVGRVFSFRSVDVRCAARCIRC